ESQLFHRGVRPAVNVGLSVSRVGGSAQVGAMRKYAGTLRLELAAFRELEAFAQFASDLDASTRAKLERGARLTELLKQPQYEPLDVALQVCSIYAGTKGYLDDLEMSAVGRFEREMHAWMRDQRADLLARIRTASKKPELNAVDADLKDALDKFKAQFKA